MRALDDFKLIRIDFGLVLKFVLLLSECLDLIILDPVALLILLELGLKHVFL